jgi:hypothetical protein
MSYRSVGRALVVLLALVGVRIQSAEAQGAWVGEAKSLSIDLAYQYVPSVATVVTPDTSVPDRNTTNHNITLSAEYVPVARLAVEVAVPLDMVKYTGPGMHLPPGEWDDGQFHTTLTDLRVGARYQVLEEPALALSPHVGASIPMMDYAVNGFATSGRHLKMLHMGLQLGRSFDPVLPNMYFVVGYEFTVPERYKENADTEKVGQLFSDVEAHLGYGFLDGNLMLDLAANWRIPHGGIDFTEFPMLSPNLTNFHDPILREEFIFVGGGISYAINPKITVGLAARFFVRGYNTRDQSLYGLNVTWQPL